MNFGIIHRDDSVCFLYDEDVKTTVVVFTAKVTPEEFDEGMHAVSLLPISLLEDTEIIEVKPDS